MMTATVCAADIGAYDNTELITSRPDLPRHSAECDMPNMGTASESRFKRRTSRPDLKLDFSKLQHPCVNLRHVKSSANMDETVAEGEVLFENFVISEIHREGLQEPKDTPICSTPEGYKNPTWAKTGRELRELADAFAKTKERERVKRRANEVHIQDIQAESFQDLLAELFCTDGGITRERIMVLFFFCSDLAIRTLRLETVDYFQRFLQWSLDFIRQKVCSWVRDQGGWAVVIENSFQYFPKVMTAVTLVFVGVMVYRWIARKL